MRFGEFENLEEPLNKTSEEDSFRHKALKPVSKKLLPFLEEGVEQTFRNLQRLARVLRIDTKDFQHIDVKARGKIASKNIHNILTFIEHIGVQMQYIKNTFKIRFQVKIATLDDEQKKELIFQDIHKLYLEVLQSFRAINESIVTLDEFLKRIYFEGEKEIRRKGTSYELMIRSIASGARHIDDILNKKLSYYNLQFHEAWNFVTSFQFDVLHKPEEKKIKAVEPEQPKHVLTSDKKVEWEEQYEKEEKGLKDEFYIHTISGMGENDQDLTFFGIEGEQEPEERMIPEIQGENIPKYFHANYYSLTGKTHDSHRTHTLIKKFHEIRLSPLSREKRPENAIDVKTPFQNFRGYILKPKGWKIVQFQIRDIHGNILKPTKLLKSDIGFYFVEHNEKIDTVEYRLEKDESVHEENRIREELRESKVPPFHPVIDEKMRESVAYKKLRNTEIKSIDGITSLIKDVTWNDEWEENRRYSSSPVVQNMLRIAKEKGLFDVVMLYAPIGKCDQFSTFFAKCANHFGVPAGVSDCLITKSSKDENGKLQQGFSSILHRITMLDMKESLAEYDPASVSVLLRHPNLYEIIQRMTQEISKCDPEDQDDVRMLIDKLEEYYKELIRTEKKIRLLDLEYVVSEMEYLSEKSDDELRKWIRIIGTEKADEIIPSMMRIIGKKGLSSDKYFKTFLQLFHILGICIGKNIREYRSASSSVKMMVSELSSHETEEEKKEKLMIDYFSMLGRMGEKNKQKKYYFEELQDNIFVDTFRNYFSEKNYRFLLQSIQREEGNTRFFGKILTKKIFDGIQAIIYKKIEDEIQRLHQGRRNAKYYEEEMENIQEFIYKLNQNISDKKFQFSTELDINKRKKSLAQLFGYYTNKRIIPPLEHIGKEDDIGDIYLEIFQKKDVYYELVAMLDLGPADYPESSPTEKVKDAIYRKALPYLGFLPDTHEYLELADVQYPPLSNPDIKRMIELVQKNNSLYAYIFQRLKKEYLDESEKKQIVMLQKDLYAIEQLFPMPEEHLKLFNIIFLLFRGYVNAEEEQTAIQNANVISGFSQIGFSFWDMMRKGTYKTRMQKLCDHFSLADNQKKYLLSITEKIFREVKDEMFKKAEEWDIPPYNMNFTSVFHFDSFHYFQMLERAFFSGRRMPESAFALGRRAREKDTFEESQKIFELSDIDAGDSFILPLISEKASFPSEEELQFLEKYVGTVVNDRSGKLHASSFSAMVSLLFGKKTNAFLTTGDYEEMIESARGIRLAAKRDKVFRENRVKEEYAEKYNNLKDLRAYLQKHSQWEGLKDNYVWRFGMPLGWIDKKNSQKLNKKVLKKGIRGANIIEAIEDLDSDYFRPVRLNIKRTEVLAPKPVHIVADLASMIPQKNSLSSLFPISQLITLISLAEQERFPLMLSLTFYGEHIRTFDLRKRPKGQIMRELNQFIKSNSFPQNFIEKLYQFDPKLPVVHQIMYFLSAAGSRQKKYKNAGLDVEMLKHLINPETLKINKKNTRGVLLYGNIEKFWKDNKEFCAAVKEMRIPFAVKKSA